MLIVTIANQKGGVGKTTVAQALISGLKRRGLKVVAIDLDQQGNLTSWFDCSNQHDAFDVFLGKNMEDMSKAIENDLIASSPRLAFTNDYFNSGNAIPLKERVKTFSKKYDVCIIDTPPAINKLTLWALAGSDTVVIPATADKYAIEGITQVYEAIKAVGKTAKSVSGILLVKYNARSIMQQEVYEALKKSPFYIYDSLIRESIAIREAQAHNKEFVDYKKTANAVKDYETFVEEFLRKELKNAR